MAGQDARQRIRAVGSFFGIIVGLVAAKFLLGVVVGLVAVNVIEAFLLHDRHFGVEWGNLPEFLAAVGTVATLAWAVFNGLTLRREANIEKALDQARRVCGWLNRSGQFKDPIVADLLLSNSANEPVYELVLYLVWLQGDGPHTGEQTEEALRDSDKLRDMRAIVQVLPPGNFTLTIPGSTDAPKKGQLGVEIAFTDGASRHWIRRVPSGDLKPLQTRPVEHYRISGPVIYKSLEPWPPQGDRLRGDFPTPSKGSRTVGGFWAGLRKYRPSC